MQLLAWRFDHTGDCNRYGNCVDHPYFELPTREEMVRYPADIPPGSAGLQYVPLEAVTTNGAVELESQAAFAELRQRAEILRAAVGEALHRVQRGHPGEVVTILGNAIVDFDKVWEFGTAAQATASKQR
jgi:hypothetical protein